MNEPEFINALAKVVPGRSTDELYRACCENRDVWAAIQAFYVSPRLDKVIYDRPATERHLTFARWFWTNQTRVLRVAKRLGRRRAKRISAIDQQMTLLRLERDALTGG